MLRKRLRQALTIICASGLAACSSSFSSSVGGGNGVEKGIRIDPGLATDSRIVTLNADGTVPDVGIDPNNTIIVQEGRTAGGFAYQVGRVSGTNRFLGVAGIDPNTRVGPAPTSAQAVYSGDYSLIYVDRNRPREPVRGDITLTADFNAQTLSGQSEGLVVDGNINGEDLSGTASYGGVNANLNGLIGASRVVGAFAGRNQNAVLTGGFYAENDN